MPNGAGKAPWAVPRDTQGEGIMAHLLLIDDDPALIPKLVCQVFPEPAHRVDVAATGRRRAGSGSVPWPPDVILLDLRLPDQSGLDVYQSDSPDRRASR